MLGACASNGPATSTGIASASGPATTAGTPNKDLTAGDDHDYRRLAQNTARPVCRLEPITGSRVKMQEVCLTRAQMKALQEGSRELLDRVRHSPAEMPALMPDGSVSKPMWSP
jgi:hypothetical protein